jgi:hypothetical protein
MVKMFTIPPHNYTQREHTIIKVLTDNKELNIQSFLNVGFHSWEDSRTHWWIKICEENNINWKILEIFKNNVEDTINKGCSKEKIQLGNILNVNEYENVDCMLFWHGPEHIDKQTFIDTLPEIEKKVNKLIIFGMPLGYEPQDVVYDNKYEIHLSEWHPEDWKKMGYDVIEVHDRARYQHMTVFKILNKDEKL